MICRFNSDKRCVLPPSFTCFYHTHSSLCRYMKLKKHYVKPVIYIQLKLFFV